MLSFKLAMLTGLIFIFSATSAWAGHQADYSMVLTMDMSGLAGMASMFGEATPDAGIPDTGMPGVSGIPGMDGEPLVMHGKVYWTADYSRIDMYYDPDMPSLGEDQGLHKGEVEESFIVFNNTGKSYRLLHADRLAIEMDAGPAQAGMEDDSSGIPDLQPDRMIRNYGEMIAKLRNTEGMTVTELAPAHINGMAVKGIAFVMDMQQIMKSMDGSNGMPDLSALSELGNANGDKAGSGTADADAAGMEGMPDLGNMLSGILSMLGNVEGKIWYSEELQIVMRMSMDIMGMNTTMEIDSVAGWQDDGNTFLIPEGYKLVTQQDYMTEQMDKINQMMESLPGDDGYDVHRDGAKLSRKDTSS